jgi:hypothetical protein
MDYIQGYLPNAYKELYSNKSMYDKSIYQLQDINDSSPPLRAD